MDILKRKQKRVTLPPETPPFGFAGPVAVPTQSFPPTAGQVVAFSVTFNRLIPLTGLQSEITVTRNGVNSGEVASANPQDASGGNATDFQMIAVSGFFPISAVSGDVWRFDFANVDDVDGNLNPGFVEFTIP